MIRPYINKIIYAIIFLIIYAFIYPPASWKHHFRDMGYALVSIKTYKDGGNLFIINNTSHYDAPLVYPPTWVIFKYTSLSIDHLIPLALFFISLFVLSSCLMIRIVSPFEMLITFLFMVSPAVLLGVERANVDIIVFSLTALFAFFLSKGKKIASVVAFFILCFSATLKFYPIFLIIPWFFNTKQKSIKFSCLTLGFLIFVIYCFFFTKENNYFLHHYPKPPDPSCVGLPILLNSIRALKINHFFIIITSFILLLITVGISNLFKSKTMTLRVGGLSKIYLFCGINILLGTFLLNSNFPYRLIFCLFLLPITFEILRNKLTSRGARKIIILVIFLLLVVLYLSDYNNYIYKNILHQSININWLSLTSQLCLILIFCIYLNALLFLRISNDNRTTLLSMG